MASVSLPLLSSPSSSSSTSHHHHHSQPPISSLNQTNCTPSPPPQNPPLKTIKILQSRLSKLCQQGQPYLARQLFDTIPRPATILYNTIIIGFVFNSLPYEALLFYSRMKSLASPIDIQCDSYTYSSTLKACSNLGTIRLGKAVHSHVLRCQLKPSRIVHNSLLNMYSTCLVSMIDREMSCDEIVFLFKYDLVRKVFDTMRSRNVISWNTMVSWYVKTKRFDEGFELFKKMMKLGVKPTAVSFVNVLPALSKLRDYGNAEVLYGMVLKLGQDYVNDFFVVSSLIFMFTELGCIGYARKIFDNCSVRNTEVWNTMIGGYVQNNYFIEGVEIFLQALDSEEVVLDEVTFLHALNAVSQLQQLELGEQLHAFILKSLSMKLNVIISNAIIVLYSRCNSIETSFKVFDQMLERDVVSWNTIVSAFVQNGMDDEGLMIVCEMQKQGFQMDYVTITALLSAASNLRDAKIGKQTHAYLLRHQIQFEGMCSYLIDMYAKSGLIDTAQKLFAEICSHDIDQATWNSMIAGHTQNGLFEAGFMVFQKMLEKNVMPNATTVVSVLPACSPMGTISLGKQLHAYSIRQLMNENVFVSSALIDMYSKSGEISYAESVFLESPEKNSVTYTNMILAYGQHGMGEEALALFDKMKGSGIKPDAVTFVAVLSACSYAGLVDKGLQIYETMEREFKIKPSAEHYSCVADMLGRVGRVMEAYKFVKELGKDGNILGIWGSLLGACRIHREIELGKIVAKELLDMDMHNGNGMTGYHVLLSNIYAAEGKWENVDRVRKEMREKGLNKEVGQSWIDIAGNVNYFMSTDQKHGHTAEIRDVLDLLTMEMKHAGYKPPLRYHINGISGSGE